MDPCPITTRLSRCTIVKIIVTVQIFSEIATEITVPEPGKMFRRWRENRLSNGDSGEGRDPVPEKISMPRGR